MKDPSLAIARRVLEIEAGAIHGLVESLDEHFLNALDLLLNCRGRVILTGMGKSGLIAKKISATLASTGTPSHFLHPAEAVHGDLGMVVSGDTVLALSNSGETAEIIRMLDRIKRLSVPLVSLVGSLDSTLARYSDEAILIHISQEACPLGLVPTASTTAALAMGDALAVALLEKRGFKAEDFGLLHPGGQLGRGLLTVGDLMHRGDRIPCVAPHTPMKEAILEMTRKSFGITAVVDDNRRLLGAITDGDLRRQLERDNGLLQRQANECMTVNPQIIDSDAFATRALAVMEEKKITSLFIIDDMNRLEGLIHLHDLWRTEMI